MAIIPNRPWDELLVGTSSKDTFKLITGIGSNPIPGDNNGFDHFDGLAGHDRILGGKSYDVLRVANNLANLVSIEELDGGGGGFAKNTILATADHDTLDFSGMKVNRFKIDGAGGDDKITGSAQKNVIIGNTGDDTMDGAGGSDIYHVGLGHGEDTFNDTGASGVDCIVAIQNGVSIGISAIAGIERISANGKSGVNVVGAANHQTLNFSNVAFTGIGVVDALGGTDTIYTSNLTAGQAYRGGTGNDTFILGSKDSKLLVSGVNQGFDIFSGNTAGATHRIVAETAATQIGIGTEYANDVDIIDGDGKSNVAVVGLSTSHDVWDLSATRLLGIAEVATGVGNDKIRVSDFSDAVGGQAYRGGQGNDAFTFGSQDTRLLVSSNDSGFDTFAGNTAGALHTIIVEDANTQVGIGASYGGTASVDIIDGKGYANVTVVGSSSSHDVWDLSETLLIGIAEVATGGGGDTIHTSNLTAGQAYRGGTGNDIFHFGDVDTILLASSADNGGNDSFFDNTAGAEHIIRAEDDGTQIGIGTSYGGANSVDVIDADGHANVAILGSSSAHNIWDFSGADLIGIARIETLGGGDKLTVSASMDPATQIILDGGTQTDTLVLRLSNAEYLAAQTEIDALVLSDGGVVNSGAFNFSAVNFENVTLDFI
ncbi:MAG: hypothetical protein KA171_17740 [Reyranella sp.]|nr:hypothetical protein [Reyranella sp.]